MTPEQLNHAIRSAFAPGTLARDVINELSKYPRPFDPNPQQMAFNCGRLDAFNELAETADAPPA